MNEKRRRTVLVHALNDKRVHLALLHPARLQQGRLKTLCGLQAVTALPLFVIAEKKSRCRNCFPLVDDEGIRHGWGPG